MSGWISVKDQMPESMQPVLYFDNDTGYVEIGMWQNQVGWLHIEYFPKANLNGKSSLMNSADISFWQPLPEKPKSAFH